MIDQQPHIHVHTCMYTHIQVQVHVHDIVIHKETLIHSIHVHIYMTSKDIGSYKNSEGLEQARQTADSYFISTVHTAPGTFKYNYTQGKPEQSILHLCLTSVFASQEIELPRSLL